MFLSFLRAGNSSVREGRGCSENMHAGLCDEIRRDRDGAVSPGGKKVVGGGALLGGQRGGEGEFDDDPGASLGSIAGGGATAVGAGNGADKGQAEAVTLRFAAFDEALEDAREEVGGEAGTIVVHGYTGNSWLSGNGN
jgi:hypothetical protein